MFTVLVPARSPVHACVPKPSTSVFPSADLTDVNVVLVGTAPPATAIDDDAGDGTAATSATAVAVSAVSETFLSDSSICPPPVDVGNETTLRLRQPQGNRGDPRSSRRQVCGELRSRTHGELRVDLRQMRLDGPDTDEELVRDLLVRAACDNKQIGRASCRE